MTTSREQLWQTELHLCHYCRAPFVDVYDSTADHIVARSKRGPTILWNLVLACKACNYAKADKDPTCGCGRCRHAVRLVRIRVDRLAQPAQQRRQRELYDWVDPTLRRAALGALAAMT